MPWVVCVLVLLVPACICPASVPNVSSALATASALAPTLLAAAGQTETAVAATAKSGGAATPTPVPSNTPAPSATSTKAPPTATPTSTNTAGPTNTPTEEPPLAPIVDACKLLAKDVVNTAMGENLGDPQKFTGTGGQPGCTWSNKALTTLVALVAPEDDGAVTVLLTTASEINAAKKCARPGAADPAAVKQLEAEFAKLGLKGNARVRGAQNVRVEAIKKAKCEAAYGLQSLPGLGDAAYTDTSFGVVDLSAVYRNLLLFLVVYKKGMPDQDAVTIGTKFLSGIIQTLEPK